MYYFLLTILVLFAVLSRRAPSIDNLLFKLEMIIMTLVLCLRYGQGSDYFGYELNWLDYNLLDICLN